MAQTAMYWQTYHLEHKKERTANKRFHRSLVREKLNKIKACPCADCGNTFPPECMDFDHVRGVKLFNIAPMVFSVSWSRLLAEIEKCDIVCANCHRIRTARRHRQEV